MLRPGNAHLPKWTVAILRRIVERIQARHPELYDLCQERGMYHATRIAKNKVLAKALEKEVYQAYGKEREKHVEMVDFEYQAKSWSSAERVCAKVESTESGINTRFIVTNYIRHSQRGLP